MAIWIRNRISGSGDSGSVPSGPAPDVVDFEAGNFDVTSGTFTGALEYDTLNEELIIETRSTLPESIENWSGVRFIVRVPDGDDFAYLFEGDPYGIQAFSPPEAGGIMMQTITLAGNDLPAAGIVIRIIANSFNAAGEENLDGDGVPTGPYVDITIPTEEERVTFARPGNVTGLSFTSAIVTDAIGEHEVTVTLTPPGDDIATGVQIYLEAPQATTPLDKGLYDFLDPVTGVQTFKFRHPSPRGSGTVPWKLWAVSYSKYYSQPLMTSGPLAAPFYVAIVGAVSPVDAALRIVSGVLGVNTGGITEDLIGTFAVSDTKIKAAAVITSKLADGVITTVKIGDRQVSALKIGLLAVETANIADAAITTAKITNLAITNALIANAAITDAKIGDVAANKITAGTISASVTLTSPSLVITNSNVTLNVDSTNQFKLSNSSTGTSVRIRDSAPSGPSPGVEMLFEASSSTRTLIRGNYIQVTPDGSTSVSVILQASSTTSDCGLYVNNQRVVGPRTASITSPSGGATIDTQARTAIDTIRAVLTAHGLTS